MATRKSGEGAANSSYNQSIDEIRADEAGYERAKERNAKNLTRVEDWNAQVIVAKENGTPLAVVWTNQHGTHVMGITDSLNHSWPDKNYVYGQAYVEKLAQEVVQQAKEKSENV